MRQVFSSARLENVERVAEMLRDAGIEVRITDGRSYKGGRRGVQSYSEKGRDSARPAVWVVKSDDRLRARDILREAGLIESTTRPGDGPKLSFRSDFDDAPGKTPAQRRMTRIKFALIGGIVIVAAVGFYRTSTMPPVPDLAAPPFGQRQPVLIPVAQAVLAKELPDVVATRVACLAVDGADAPSGVRDALRPPDRLTIVPVSHCQRIANEETGSLHPNSKQPATIVDVSNFRPTAADAGTVEYSAYHHRMLARYKTLEVRRIDGRWQVVRTLKHVSS
jgi:hypothetical protein